MIEPAARCNKCHRTISSTELTVWAKARTAGHALTWWSWNINGWCAECTRLEHEIVLEEVNNE